MSRNRFAEQLERFKTVVLDERARAVVHDVVDATLDSIKHGSAITGAPGQPIDDGDLIESWQRTRIGPTEWLIRSTYFTAPWIEEGILPNAESPFTIRSSVGGTHSVALTAQNFDRLAEDVVARVAPNG